MRWFPSLTLVALAALVIGSSLGGFAEDSPSEPIPDDATIAKLDMGAYWFGKQVTKADLRGKVVLLEIRGS